MQFHVPTTISINGMSGSGKSSLLHKLLKHKDILFDKPIKKIMYAYGVWTSTYDEMEKSMDIEFHQNLPTEDTVTTFADGSHCILVIDDLMDRCVKDEGVQNFFTRSSHHLNSTIIYLSLNLLCQGKSLNTHFIILMKSVRDMKQISVLEVSWE